MDEKHAIEMAMFRFGLIAPALNGTFTQASKYAYYREVAAEPLTLPDGTSAVYAQSTLAHWEGLYRKGGFEALVVKKRADKGHSRKLAAEAADAIIAMKREFPRINSTMIYERLIEQGVINKHEVSLSTVQRFVRARADLCGVPEGVKDRMAFEAECVCGIWQADTMYGSFVGEGKKRSRSYLMSIIDDKSRLITGARFFLSDNAQNFQTVFKDAVIRFGIPQKLYCDNGGPYRNDQLTGICGRLGAVLVHAAVNDGAAKGKIERLNRTCRGRMLSVLTEKQTASLDSLNDALSTWVATYNTTVHSAHGMTPMDAYRKGLGDVREAKDAEWVSECFLNRIARTVRNDSTITIDCASYDVPMTFIGMRVEVRHAPGDMAGAHIFSEGKAYPLIPTDRVVNSRTARSAGRYYLDYSNTGGDSDAPAVIPA